MTLALAACHSEPSPHRGAPKADPTTTLAIAGPDTDNTTLVAPHPEEGAPALAQTSPTAPESTPAITSCNAAIGRAAATRLAAQCRKVSPATRPPCDGANSCAMIRDEIARGCTFLGKNADPACRADPAGVEAAANVIRRYYSAIDAHDYSTAYQDWENEGKASNQSYAAFAKGFAATQKTRVGIGALGRIEGAAGSAYVTVPVTIDAMLRNGRQQHFTGSYTLRRSNDVPGASIEDKRWRIHSAALRGGSR